MDATPAWVDLLPTVNASFNAVSACFVVAGWRFVRAGQVALHRKCMGAALVASSLFLVGYLTRYALTGTTRFVGSPGLRLAYLTILWSHMLLAVVTVPLVLRTVYLAVTGRLDEHRRIVPYTLPIWLYVSVTGVVVYVMLYHVSAGPTG